MSLSSHHSADHPIAVRAATLDDLETLVHFNCALARETEARELDADRVRRGVQAALEDPGRARWLVACDASTSRGAPIGQLMTTPEWSDWRCGWFLWIQSVYVDPAWRRRGVYTALHARVLEDARRDASLCGVRLYLHRANAAARRTYLALGMHETPYEVLEVELP